MSRDALISRIAGGRFVISFVCNSQLCKVVGLTSVLRCLHLCSKSIGVWTVACWGQRLASSTGHANVAYQGYSWKPTSVQQAERWVRNLPI
jgi:hypothetical protein